MSDFEEVEKKLLKLNIFCERVLGLNEMKNFNIDEIYNNLKNNFNNIFNGVNDRITIVTPENKIYYIIIDQDYYNLTDLISEIINKAKVLNIFKIEVLDENYELSLSTIEYGLPLAIIEFDDKLKFIVPKDFKLIFDEYSPYELLGIEKGEYIGKANYNVCLKNNSTRHSFDWHLAVRHIPDIRPQSYNVNIELSCKCEDVITAKNNHKLSKGKKLSLFDKYKIVEGIAEFLFWI